MFDFLFQNLGQITPVMIYGTKVSAVGIARMLQSGHDDVKYKLVGFIDDDKAACERVIMGVKVYHLNEETLKRKVVKKAKAIIVSPMKMKKLIRQTIWIYF